MKPSDFFVGVTDFFSIILPGAGLTFIALFWVNQLEIPADHVLASLVGLDNAKGWAAFAIISYVLGHVVASLGAHLDPLYDARKSRHRNEALKKLADLSLAKFIKEIAPTTGAAKQLGPDSPTLFARFVDRMFLSSAWKGKALEDTATRPEQPINAYKLARLILNYRAPTLFAEVARFEADSKFFRSLAVVAAFALLACIVQLVNDLRLFALGQEQWVRPTWGLAYLVLMFAVLRIAFARFCELRLKATETAFQGMLVVALPARKEVPTVPMPLSTGPPTGAIEDKPTEEPSLAH